MEAYSLEQVTPEKKKSGRPKGLKRYDINPFLKNENLIHKKTKTNFMKVISNKDVKVGNTTIGHGVYIGSEREVSGEKFIKVYARYCGVWFDLSNAAMRVFGLIFCFVMDSPNGSTMFYLSPIDPKIKKHIKTETLFYRAIRELIDRGFLARHIAESWYWVNPFILGKGDLIKTINTLKLDKSNESLNEIQELLNPNSKRKI